jgi:N-acetyltransferase
MTKLRYADEVLGGVFVRLEPLAQAHLQGLVEAANESRETFGLTLVPDDARGMQAYIDDALSARDMGLAVPYASVRVSDGRVLGSTRFASAERWHWTDREKRASDLPDAVEIGWTWLRPSAQRSAANTEAKLSMLSLAFERWQVQRVMLKTDARNVRSRANIERIGGKLDGILRAHMPAYDGGVRDSAMYSILPAEWPAIRARFA